jgi:hypothetical protein
MDLPDMYAVREEALRTIVDVVKNAFCPPITSGVTGVESATTSRQ